MVRILNNIRRCVVMFMVGVMALTIVRYSPMELSPRPLDWLDYVLLVPAIVVGLLNWLVYVTDPFTIESRRSRTPFLFVGTFCLIIVLHVVVGTRR